MDQESGAADPTSDASGLTLRQLVRLTVPLSFTFLMMSGAAPVVTGGIAWSFGSEGERVHLASFFLTFSTAILLYSPAFVARNVALRVVTDRRSMLRFVIFYLSGMIPCSAVILVVSLSDDVGRFVFMGLLDATEEMQALARQGLLAFAPIPMLIVIRGLSQACHVSNDRSWYVGAGTALRLIVMATFVFGFAVWREMSGPVLGGLTFLLGIGVETCFVTLTIRGTRQWKTRAAGPLLGYPDLARYAMPLMSSAVLEQVVAPLLIYMINRAQLPAESLSSYDLIRSTMWMLMSVMHTVEPAIVNYATSRANFRLIIRFGACLLAGTTAFFALIAFTPFGEWIYRDILRVDNETIRELTYRALRLIFPLPLVATLSYSFTALHTRSGRTRWVMWGSLAAMAALVLMIFVADLRSINGVVAAVAGYMLFQVVKTIVQVPGLFGGGLSAALTRYSLAEEVNKP